MNQSERRQYLIRSLLNENPAYRDWGVPQDADDQRLLLRGLLLRRAEQLLPCRDLSRRRWFRRARRRAAAAHAAV